MKLLLAASLLVVISMAFSFSLREFELEEEWSRFKTIYGRRFGSIDDENIRKEIFESNLQVILIHNIRYSRGMETFKMDVNEFSDMTMDEFRETRLTVIDPESYYRNISIFLPPLSLSEVPSEVDWRAKGLVTPVKNQGRCGSCWAFGATGAIEGQHARKTRTLVSLSEQNLVDCTRPYGNNGCNGGKAWKSFDYVIKNDGIDTAQSYPYTGVEARCAFKKESVGATIRGYVGIPRGNEKRLQEAVATVGPVAVSIDASHPSFMHYKSGVYFEPRCTAATNHAVLVVGYGTEKGNDYWLVKNSWGPNWGERGYIKMARNKQNNCGIANYALFPTV